MYLQAGELEGLENGDDLLDPGEGFERLEARFSPLVADGADDVALDSVNDVGLVPQLSYLLKDFLEFFLGRSRAHDDDHCRALFGLMNGFPHGTGVM